MKTRALKTMHIIGMCQAGSDYTEGVVLPNGDELSVIKEPGDGVCIAMGGLAARYAAAELERIGDGSADRGMLMVVHSLRTNPAGFQYGALRPFEPIKQ